MLPLLSLVVVKAAVPRMHTHCAIMTEFIRCAHAHYSHANHRFRFPPSLIHVQTCALTRALVMRNGWANAVRI